MEKPNLLVDCQNAHGEGIVWCKKTKQVFWTDIEGCKLWSYCPDTAKTESFDMPDRLCAFMLKDKGTILAAFDSYVAVYNYLEQRMEKLFEFEPDNPYSRLNDGKIDPYGNFVVGGMNESDDDRYRTSVIKIGKDLSVTTLLTGISCANSICFSPDGNTMYFSDTPEKTIVAYPYSSSCKELNNPRQLYVGKGRLSFPDGSAIDREGYIWNAVWNGYSVIRIDPQTGEIDKEIRLPVKNPTCVALGGKEEATLFITTSRLQMSEAEIADEPLSGGLFAIDIPTTITEPY